MGDNKISEAAVEVFQAAYKAEIKRALPHVLYSTTDRIATVAGISAVLLHLHGEAVPVAHGWLVARPDVSPFFVPATHPHIIESFQTALAVECGTTVTPVYLHPQPAELNEVSGNSGELPPLPAPKYLAKLSQSGEWAELAVMPDWTAEMWAWGTDEVFSKQQMQDYARSALAATGKQQVGEVQGSREQFEAWARPQFPGEEAFDRIAGRPGGWEYIGNNVQAAWAAWQAAIASRQPVGAQGIDLGQFRDLIGFAVYQAIYLPETDPRRDFIRQANELLALIDGRDAGTGVKP